MSLSLFAKISQIFGRAATFKILVPIYWNFRNRASSAIYARIWVTRPILAIFPGVQNVAFFTSTFVGHPRIFGASFGTFSTIFTRTWTTRTNTLLSCSCCSLEQSWKAYFFTPKIEYLYAKFLYTPKIEYLYAK